jgi:hypothetical protein
MVVGDGGGWKDEGGRGGVMLLTFKTLIELGGGLVWDTVAALCEMRVGIVGRMQCVAEDGG